MAYESNFDLSNLPPKSKVGYLDQEIAGEGHSANDFVPYDSGVPNIGWAPAPTTPVFPDPIKYVKGLRKYDSANYKFQPFPTWVYHPTEKAKKVTERQAFDIGVRYRKATSDERVKYGAAESFYDCRGDWRTSPFDKDIKFDPQNPGPGKTYIPATFDPAKAQLESMRLLASSQRGSGNSAEIDVLISTITEMQRKLEELQLQVGQTRFAEEAEGAMIEMESAVNEIEAEISNALTAEQDKEVWKAAAEQKGIKVDGRWSLKRLKEEVDNKVA